MQLWLVALQAVLDFYMFLAKVGGAMVGEDGGKLDDETLRKRAQMAQPTPDMNIEDPTRRIWIFTTARYQSWRRRKTGGEGAG